MVDVHALRAAILTEGAEETCEQLMLSAAEYDRIQASPVGWALDPSNGGHAALSYVTRFVILVEVFTFGRVIELSDTHAGTIVSPVFDALYKAHRNRIDSSWDAALDALKMGWPSIGPKQYAEYPALRGYIQARNSWAHGHGKLTGRQSKELDKAKSELAQAGFALVGEQVQVRPQQVREVARKCREFVRKVDRATSPHL